MLLPDHLDVDDWRKRWRAGAVPDETPYGYHHAEAEGFSLTWGEKLVPASGLVSILFRLGRRLLGFDVEHAWRNRKGLFGPQTDLIWTHTEREFLPVVWWSMVLRRPCPPMIAQIVWLADEWHRLSAFKRWLWRSMLERVDVVTCHSPENFRFLKSDLGLGRVKLVEFGIAPDLCVPAPCVQAESGVTRPIRVLTMGNDRHRDWPTLAKAVGGQDGLEVFVASATYPDHLLAPNMVRQVCDFAGVRARLQWCDVVVVPVVSNLHASGLTVVMEAVASGKPVVMTDTGGLRHYFGADAVWMAPVGDAEALRAQIIRAAKETEQTLALRQKAYERFRAMDLDTRGYAHRHVVISRELLTQWFSCRKAER